MRAPKAGTERIIDFVFTDKLCFPVNVGFHNDAKPASRMTEPRQASELGVYFLLSIPHTYIH